MCVFLCKGTGLGDPQVESSACAVLYGRSLNRARCKLVRWWLGCELFYL